VHTEAGWGKIETISLEGQARQWFDPEREMPELGVVLRPTRSPIRIFLSMCSEKIVFPERSTLYQCTKGNGCNGFISIWRDDVTFEHNRAAHDGILASSRQVPSHEYKYSIAPTFQRHPPDNEFQ
jgi:hypothetical protein